MQMENPCIHHLLLVFSVSVSGQSFQDKDSFYWRKAEERGWMPLENNWLLFGSIEKESTGPFNLLINKALQRYCLNCKQTAEVWNIFVLIFQEVSSCIQKCSLYHYITTNGKYKSAVIIQLNKEIGSDLSKVLLIFQVSKCHFLQFMG